MNFEVLVNACARVKIITKFPLTTRLSFARILDVDGSFAVYQSRNFSTFDVDFLSEF